MLKTEAIANYLQLNPTPLSNRYDPGMEVQVNVAKGDGVHVKGEYFGKRWRGWQNKNTGEVWKSFRIPWKADTNPEYRDTTLNFDLASHVEGIGLTGWRWVSKTSLWVGFDFDSIINHEQGLSVEQLEEIRKLLMDVPWATIHKSTSGKGLHVYVDFSEPVPTSNHTEHAALGRAILSLLSIKLGYSLETAVDACGTVLWISHKKQSQAVDGFKLVKIGEKLDVSKIPSNWKDHVAVVSKKTLKIAGNKTHDLEFKELYASMHHNKLDAEHKRVLSWFDTKAERDFWWDADHNMLVCHTLDLLLCHRELELKGIFSTNSSGSTAQNCYAFPLPNGVWVVRRHSFNVNEHVSWIKDPSGWTRCLFNDIPEYVTAVRTNGGKQTARGEYVFTTCEEGVTALKQLEIDITVPAYMMLRSMAILAKGDKLIIAVQRDKNLDPTIDDTFLLNKKGDTWELVVPFHKKKKEIYSPDHLIRHAIIDKGAEAGWWINIKESWIQQSRQNVASVLMANENASRGDLDPLLSKSILNPWTLVNIPFVCEYPGNRQWNKTAAKLAVAPKPGNHATWLTVLNHVGKGLDNAVATNDWCVDNAITTGAEYLSVWIASMFQKPEVPLPYLFCIGPQNSGKSTLHEALATLMSSGYVRADHALTSPSGFNAEIASAVLCVVEETNLKGSNEAANRIKDWVTGRTITIRAMRRDAYDITNTTHWIQCANDGNYCPVFPDDTHIVVCWVDVPDAEIPKSILFGRLEDEREGFLDYVMSIELPPSIGRLGVPCIVSEDKRELQLMNMTELEQFIAENTYPRLGYTLAFSEFYEAFIKWLPPHRHSFWTKRKVSENFPKTKPYKKGRHGNGGHLHLGNITFNPESSDLPNAMVLSTNGTLILEGVQND